MRNFKNNRKRYLIIFCTAVLLAFIVILLHNKYYVSEDISVGEKNVDCFLDVHVGFDKNIVIPDPAKVKANGKIYISLLSEENVAKVYDNGRWYKKNGDLYLGTDLSFAGFNRPVFVSSYAVGDMTEDSGVISYLSERTAYEGFKKKKVKGSCLVLFVTTKLERYEEEDSDESYFVILDYKNGVSYKKKTNFYLPYHANWLDLFLTDVTNDGIQELTVQWVFNKSNEIGIYHANAKKHKIEVVYSTISDAYENYNYMKPGWDFIDRLEFKGKLKDNYKVELMVPRIGYSKTISVIKNGGYNKKSLHNKRDKWECINYVGMWKKNGKLRKKWAKKNGKIYLAVLWHVRFPKDKDGNTLVKFNREVFIGHRSYGIGEMYISMKYDKDLRKLVAVSAEYVDENGVVFKSDE